MLEAELGPARHPITPCAFWVREDRRIRQQRLSCSTCQVHPFQNGRIVEADRNTHFQSSTSAALLEGHAPQLVQRRKHGFQLNANYGPSGSK